MGLMEVLKDLLENNKDVYKIKGKEIKDYNGVFFVSTDVVEGARNVIMICDAPHFETDRELCVNSTTIEYEYEKVDNEVAKYWREKFDLR